MSAYVVCLRDAARERGGEGRGYPVQVIRCPR
jgi:hypothetical protein